MSSLDENLILKSDHSGKIISEDIRSAKQAAEKICEMGSPWADVTADEIKVCRLHFRKEGVAENRSPSPGVVLFAERNGMVAFIKAFSGETERVVAVVAKKDVWTDHRSGEIDYFNEQMTFRTYNGVWAWRRGKIVDAKVLSYWKRKKDVLQDLKSEKIKGRCNEHMETKIADLEDEIATLERALFGN